MRRAGGSERPVLQQLRPAAVTPYHRLGLWLTRSVPGVYFLRHVWTPLDILVLRLTQGRRSLAPRAIPEMWLTTIGRKTHRVHSTPVLYLKDGDRYVVVGSNYGRPRHPAWTHNLRANGTATVQIGAHRQEVGSRLATPDEIERYWPRLLEIWPGWATYRRMTERDFWMFVLEPRSDVDPLLAGVK